MAIVTKGVVVLADTFDLSCHLTDIEAGGDTDMQDATTLCTTGFRSFLGGLTERSVNGNGFFHYDPVTDSNSVDDYFNDNFAGDDNNLITIGVDGADPGDPALIMNAKQASYQVGGQVGEILPFSFEMKTSLDGSIRNFANGVWLMYQNITGSVNGTTVDGGAAPATGYLAQLHTMRPNNKDYTAKVQHSTDGSAWVDLVTFTTPVSATGNSDQKSSTVTSVNRYIRAVITLSTGTGGFIGIAFKRGFSG